MASTVRLIPWLREDIQRGLSLEGNTSVEGWRLWIKVLSPRFAPVLLYRLAHSCHRRGWGAASKALSMVNFVVFGIEIAARCEIGPGLYLPHTQGTVIGAWSIGKNAVIYQGVTIGAKELDFAYSEVSRPKLGDNVTIGAGAKVLGGVQLGPGARIGANAVVITSVPEGALAVGIPAKVLST
ncbi:2,3,4,5-tetrahydropyridine-2,6-dicarboxylate N-acetyltransferase [Ralstonia mannitolilytica]|uniref:serine O-acetyltransferase n=2 Tax=Ralstonia mannitolilytica TaxID=105219 RepID=UPI0007AFE80B|nr:serine O-acetyltransferase [Ralstonia mannitolilytica]ANA34118.1 serine acetyltransferase [Ralstonia mannitolilytica]CAJ0737533.1 2,3,4,5-tetrahydropyridine-2,6-dicarboxylate N-acetyltransferase [Ralstonia mannitolilytica]CAJ0777160.1 2,3,4,5-tetrahydropyridine-2,6-dicarboxylate N-acetyltransferase [Ralstonia mannitolilytica]